MIDAASLLPDCAERLALSLMRESTPDRPAWNRELLRSGGRNQWNYVDGCMILSFLELFRLTHRQEYLRFSDSFMERFVLGDGSVKTMDPSSARLDDICGARTFFPLYELTKKEKYRTACDVMFQFLRSFQRTASGNFWHKRVYPHQVWLDGSYMAIPFYMEYETKYNGMQNYHDIYGQLISIRKNMRDPETGLYYHGYDASRSAEWADPVTGCSAGFWLRSIGWFAMALTDTLENMDEQIYYEYREIETMLKDLIDALLPWQDGAGMFNQVVNCPEDKRNYPETSGTCMVAYAILKATRLRLLPARYRPYGEKALLGTAASYFHVKDGTPFLSGICLVGGLGGPQKRNGTPAYYYGEPVMESDGKGVAPFLLACCEFAREQGEAKWITESR